ISEPLAPEVADVGDRDLLAAGLVAYHSRNYAVARDRWLPLAEAGVKEAQYRLGLLYSQEDFSGVDLAAAYKWLSLAADQGDARATAELEAMQPRLSAAETARGRDMAKAWRADRRSG